MVDNEVARLKRELEQVKEERDILKKTARHSPLKAHRQSLASVALSVMTVPLG